MSAEAALTATTQASATAPTEAAVTPPEWGGVRGVLLDADDTLYDTRAAMHEAGAVAAAQVWPGADPELVAKAGVRFRDDPDGIFGAYTRGEIEFDAMRRARVGALARWLGAAEDEDDVRFFDVYEPAFSASLRSFPDVEGMVRTLRERGLPVGVLTNSSGAYTAAKLASSGLVGLFDVVCSRDTLGFGKPDARALHEACRRLGTAPGETLYVGDELRNDPLGAAGAGMPAAWLVRAGLVAEADRAAVAAHGIPVVSSLSEVTRLLEACRATGDLGTGAGHG